MSRGIYLDVTGDREVLDGFDQARRDHLVTALAVARASPGSYVVGPSSCIARGLPVLTVPEQVHLARPGRLWSTRPEVLAHRSWPHEPPSVDPTLGVALQPTSAALVETAARGGALAGLIPADAALARGLPLDVAAALTAWGCRPGARTARAMARLADGRRESPLETSVAWEADREGYELIPQVVVRDGAGEWIARVDFQVRGSKVAVEADGIGKYRSHRDFRDERVRHNLIEELGWIVVRVCSDDLRFGRFVPRLAAAVSRAR